MATTANTTAAVRSKDLARSHTPVTRAFNRLVARLDAFVELERRVDAPGTDVLSPSFTETLREAERARETLCEAIGDTLTVPDYRPEDRALRRLAHVLYFMLTCEDDGDRQHFHETTVHHRDIFRLDGESVAARLSRGLSNSFFTRFDDLACLREFGGEGAVACPETAFAPVPA